MQLTTHRMFLHVIIVAKEAIRLTSVGHRKRATFMQQTDKRDEARERAKAKAKEKELRPRLLVRSRAGIG